MSFKSNRQNVAGKPEVVEGVDPGSFVDADSPFRILERPEYAPDIEQFERQNFGNTIGNLSSIAGSRGGTILAPTEFVGSGSLALPPPIGICLRSSGYKETPVIRIPIGAVAGGPFLAGEGLTQASSGAVGLCAITVRDGDAFLFVHTETGTFDTTSIDGDNSGASVTPSGSPVDPAGFAYVPISEGQESFTYKRYTGPRNTGADGQIKTLVGARSNFTSRFQVGDSVRLEVNIDGVHQTVIDGPYLVGTKPTISPPKFMGAEFALQDGYAAIVQALELSPGNDLQRRPDARSDSGLIATEIASRAGSGSVNPEHALVTDHDFFGKLEDNAQGAITTRVGTTDGNQFWFQAPNAQYVEIAEEDRAGIEVANITLQLNEILGNDDLIIIAG